MIQLADSAVQTPPRFDWREALQWETILKIAIVIVIAMVAYRIITILIRRLLQREIEEEDPLVRRLREQRAQTLASLLGNVALVAIFIVVTLTILDILLDNIAPILASFGILGLAFSFGAQSLVKDVISGTFMLMEGQFGIGDVVRVSDVSGAVEKITLRTTVLRDVEGVVHIIPNGEITRVSNLTKSWSRAVLNIGVAYREDVDRVIDVLRDLVREFHADPEWGALLLEEPQVPGVESLGDSAVVIRVSAKTLPLKQWDVARELRRRIKKRFDHEGIEIPFPHTTMYWGDGQMPALPAAVDSDLT
jgi:moderate conductance mechanosensitive channel